jgi:hypothetical protein
VDQSGNSSSQVLQSKKVAAALPGKLALCFRVKKTQFVLHFLTGSVKNSFLCVVKAFLGIFAVAQFFFSFL